MTYANQGTATDLWSGFLSQVRPKLSKHVVQTWLHPIRCLDFTEGTVTLEVRDQFARDWLTDHYLDFIRNGLKDQAGQAVAIDWIINPKQPPPQLENEPTPAEEPAPVVHNRQARRPQFNSRYVFDAFVSGPSNQFAFAACQAVAENPASSYNPLFLFGGVGLGKTHLLCAIGHMMLENKPSTRVIYTSSEQFMNEVVSAVRFSKLEEFHAKYRRNCDILLMDDIQLIAGKDRTQNEFFHIFNILYDSQRQIVVTSDKLPHEIPEIEERLRSRFQWGLIADIQPPEIETRIAILQKKADNEGLQIPDAVTLFLAENIRSNVRELEGALVRLMAHSSLTGTPLSVDYAKEVLGEILSCKALQLSVESIQKLVATYYQLRVADLKSSRRLKTLIRPRQVAMYLCRKHAGSSFPELGCRFGNKDHTTIMSACRKIESFLKIDHTLRSQVLELERQLDVK